MNCPRSGLLLVLLCALLGCGDGGPPKTSIAGQVFVRTEGGQSIAFGLVDVYAIPEETLRRYLDARKAHRDSALRGATDRLAGWIDSIDGEIVTSTKARPEYDPEDRRLRRRLQGRVARFLKTGTPEYYFTSLPAAEDTATTGANGRFRLVVPSGRTYYLMARTTRTVGQYEERYHWGVAAPARGDSTRVLLTNRNAGFLVEEGYAQSRFAYDNAATDIARAAAHDERQILVNGAPTTNWERVLLAAIRHPDSIRAAYR